MLTVPLQKSTHYVLFLDMEETRISIAFLNQIIRDVASTNNKIRAGAVDFILTDDFNNMLNAYEIDKIKFLLAMSELQKYPEESRMKVANEMCEMFKNKYTN